MILVYPSTAKSFLSPFCHFWFVNLFLDDIDDTKYCGHLHGLGTTFINQAAPPPTTAPASTATTDNSNDKEENSIIRDNKEDPSNTYDDNSDHNINDGTPNDKIDFSTKEAVEKVEVDENRNLSQVLTTSENIDVDNVPMDTSETVNTARLVSRSSLESSLSDELNAKDENLDSTNSNNLSNPRNAEDIKE